MSSDLPITVNFDNRKRGDTKPFRGTSANPDGTDTSLTGYSFVMVGNTNKKPTDATGQVFAIDGTIDSDGNYSFTPAITDVDLLGKVHYNVQMIDPSGIITTLVEGYIKFTQDIAKQET